MKKVYQVDLNGEIIKEWDSAGDAARSLSLDTSHISKVASGKRNVHGGFKWKYVDEDIEDDVPPSLNLDEIDNSIYSNARFQRDYQEFLNWRKNNKEEIKYTQGMHFIFPDVHCPFENKPFVNAALNLATDLGDQVKGLHLIGDFADVNSLSSHDRGKVAIEGITLGWEYDQCNKLLDKFDTAFKDVKDKNFLWGNHEDRYKRYMSKVDNNKLGTALPSPTAAMKLYERGYNVQENWKEGTIYLGRHLELMHGDFTNIHAAKKHIDVYRTSIIFGHIHRFQTYIEGNVGGWSIGWMGDSSSPAFNYASKAQKLKWNNAFAIVNIDEDGYYFVEPILWQNGKFYYGGKCYK